MRALLLAALVLGFAGCADREEATAGERSYQGKPDTKPWENEPFKGDRAGWETQIKTRQLTQHEYQRIGQ